MDNRDHGRNGNNERKLCMRLQLMLIRPPKTGMHACSVHVHVWPYTMCCLHLASACRHGVDAVDSLQLHGICGKVHAF